MRERIFAQDVSSCFNCLFSAISLSVVSQYTLPSDTVARSHFVAGDNGRDMIGTRWRKDSLIFLRFSCLFLEKTETGSCEENKFVSDRVDVLDTLF